MVLNGCHTKPVLATISLPLHQPKDLSCTQLCDRPELLHARTHKLWNNFSHLLYVHKEILAIYAATKPHSLHVWHTWNRCLLLDPRCTDSQNHTFGTFFQVSLWELFHLCCTGFKVLFNHPITQINFLWWTKVELDLIASPV